MSLTTIQSEILQYIRKNLESRGVAPSTSEICQAFGFKSFGTVARHMKRLEEKGYLKRAGRRNKQGVSLRDVPQAVNIPLAGQVAAGIPLEKSLPNGETISVPLTLVRDGEHFALRVKGNSMVEDGIMDGDLIVVRRQEEADNGQTVVAVVKNETTVKKLYRAADRVELRPANATMRPIMIAGQEMRDFRIQGIVVGLLRQFA